MPHIGGHGWWPEATAAVGSVFGAGGIAAFVRERRRGKKDAADLALALIDRESQRVDELVRQVERLQGRVEELSSRNSQLEADNRRLRRERDALLAPPAQTPAPVQVQVSPPPPPGSE